MILKAFAKSCLALCLLAQAPLTAQAAEKKLPYPVPQKPRKLSAVSPATTRVLTISCTEQSSGTDQALAIALMASDDSGSFSMSLYLRPGTSAYVFKQLSGRATTVPNGLVFQSATWSGNGGDNFLLHAHPADTTSFPGASGTYACRITGDMKP
jgi:hypothetical protein